MPSPKERKPLSDGQFYDKLGRRRSLEYKKRGPKRRWPQREIDGDFSGNNELLIYIGLTRGDDIIGVLNTEHVRKAHALADESGNPKIWRRGDPVEMLPEGMKKRIEMAQQFGV